MDTSFNYHTPSIVLAQMFKYVVHHELQSMALSGRWLRLQVHS